MAAHIAEQERTKRAERRATLMGTEAHVIVVGDDAAHLADVAIARLQRLEARWSRFLPDSEISRLNNSPGVPVLVTPETFRLIDHALAAWQLTDGAFDPTILADLRAEGYDRSFELLDAADPSAPTGASVELDARRQPPSGSTGRTRHSPRSDRRERSTRSEHDLRSRRDRKGIRRRHRRDRAPLERRARRARRHRRRSARRAATRRRRAPGSSRSPTRSTRST